GIHQFDYTEDSNGNIIQTDVTNSRGFVTRYTYDSTGYYSGGSIVSETRARGMPEQQVYTYLRQPGSNLVLSVTYALNRNRSYTYDSKANFLTITSLSGTPNAVTTTMTYDPTFNVMNSIADPLTHTTQMTIDPATGNVTAIADPLGHQTTMTYNTAGQ